MRTYLVVTTAITMLAASAAHAEDWAAAPTTVYQPGIYGCPAHADFRATWPAPCPLCQTVLEAVPPSASTAVDVTPAAGRYDLRRNGVTEQMQRDQQWRQRARRNEQWRQWGQRNELLRQRARRNAELRGQARRNEEFRQGYPTYGELPPEGYAYPYPYNYYYNRDTGRYEYLRPNQPYPYGGYQYNPNAGLRYYNPNADQYYYNPNAGHYYYNPNTGQYKYVNPRYTFLSVDLIPGIDMDNRRRDEEEEQARAARRKEALGELARRNARLWGQYHSYGYQPPGGYPYTYPPPGYAYPYPYNYNANPKSARPYGGYYYSPDTGQYYYRPRAGPYSYNPHTGQYEDVPPGSAYPNPRNEQRRPRQDRQRR